MKDHKLRVERNHNMLVKVRSLFVMILSTTCKCSFAWGGCFSGKCRPCTPHRQRHPSARTRIAFYDSLFTFLRQFRIHRRV